MNIRQAPLRSKLRFVILTTCGVALLVACGALFAVQFYVFRRDFYQDTASVAGMLANRLPPSIDFENEDRAKEILASLAVKSHFLGASVQLNDGRIFASYRNFTTPQVGKESASKTSLPGEVTPRAMLTRDGGQLVCSQPIEYKGERLGTLYVVADYGGPAGRLISLYLAIFCVVSALAALVVLVISGKLARLVTSPLRRLADTVRRIAGSNDYSVRAQKVADDEVGEFTDAFNQMIGRIEDRDADLRREIAEREKAEREVQAMHSQLIEASRQAGMAEVATGVLHNVGNVLNSVNVSATLVSEKLGIHRLNNLARTADLLREHEADLGRYLSTDPKGRLIPGYITDLSKHLITERQDALTELELLTKNIEHIKEIVSMQQNYARVAGMSEQVTVDSLVEDALRMTMGSLHRHHIEVVRNYAPGLPPVLVERHKTLQILVNLIRNAKHALDDASPASKILTLCIRPAEDDKVGIEIVDNGIGIPEENLTRIFSHGFTTRKDGHGFGLHSAALAAQQMGGQLHARSEGHMRGASFILTLPKAPAKAAASA